MLQLTFRNEHAITKPETVALAFAASDYYKNAITAFKVAVGTILE